MNRVFQKSIAALALAVCLLVTDAAAQTTGSIPILPVDAKTLRVQNQAEEVYERTDYDRAFFIYRNELAPIGDKYGQYMVGFMYLTGKGVEEDRVMASAWYRLAAERGMEEFVRVSNQVMASLDDEQRALSDREYIDLRLEYSDLALLAGAIRQDYEVLHSSTTGSRISGGSGAVSVVDMSSGGVRSGSDYYGRIERRLKARLEYIDRNTEIDIDSVDTAKIDVTSIERQVEAYLRKLD